MFCWVIQTQILNTEFWPVLFQQHNYWTVYWEDLIFFSNRKVSIYFFILIDLCSCCFFFSSTRKTGMIVFYLYNNSYNSKFWGTLTVAKRLTSKTLLRRHDEEQKMKPQANVWVLCFESKQREKELNKRIKEAQTMPETMRYYFVEHTDGIYSSDDLY